MSNINAYYSQGAANYDDLAKHRDFFDQPFGEDLKRMTNPSPGLDIVDMACGTGYLSKVLDKQGIKTTILVEPCKELLTLSESAFPSAKAYCMDALEFSKQPIKYDRIVINGSFHLFPLGTLEETVLNFRSQLRSGGMVIIISQIISPMFKAARGIVHDTSYAGIKALKAAGFEVASEPMVTRYQFEIPREDYEKLHRSRFLSEESELTDDEIEHGINEMNLSDPVVCEYKHIWVIASKQ
ncbi:uncharacterized protein LOC135482520 [Lineus longissimus]|uniref:uncharacterized protein LOC135482520 n=1 Tax=Lineus longissimus TaxID=88925 RepID=UPI00315C8814